MSEQNTQKKKKIISVQSLVVMATLVAMEIVLSRILGMNGVWLSFLASEMLTFVVILILSRKKESVSNDYI